MLSGLRLAVVVLLATSSADTTDQPCRCSAVVPGSLSVNCSFLNLIELPHLPSDTKELFVEGNRLTSVSPGMFDRLVDLEKVSLSGNTFHCDCRIRYLRSWLLRNRAIVSKEPTCASPRSVAGRAITELTDEHFSSCTKANCTGWTFNTVICAMLCCLIALLLWSVKLAKMSMITLYIDKKRAGFEAVALHSLRPKRRRRRLHSVLSVNSQEFDSFTYTEYPEWPLLDMELLPQVLDVLHKNHNITINLPEWPLS